VVEAKRLGIDLAEMLDSIAAHGTKLSGADQTGANDGGKQQQ
jgi:hypothetical protein